MEPKPRHLGPEYGAQFQDRSVVEVYRYRPPYPAEVFMILLNLLPAEPRAVLDVGCGNGAIARGLAPVADRVDAVDFSRWMIDTGRTLPGGARPNLNWICASAEDAPLSPPYDLITAGASLHWMDWAVVLPRFWQALAPSGFLAIVEAEPLSSPWSAELSRIIPRFSTNRDFQPYNLIEELERRELFVKRGEKRTEPVRFVQPIEEYIESFHARNGFSRERMNAEQAAAFDSEVADLVSAYYPKGMVELQVVGTVIWGLPMGL